MVKKNWSAQTELIHGGNSRSQFGETSEALYLTSGFVYDSAEQAAARFAKKKMAIFTPASETRPCALSKNA